MEPGTYSGICHEQIVWNKNLKKERVAWPMTLQQKKRYTIEDINALPEEQRAELFNGRIYMMELPDSVHQKLVANLTIALGNYKHSTGGGCEVFPAPFAIFPYASTDTYVEPDISIVCDKGILSNQGCEGAPDFIIEIVSSSSRRMDYAFKNALYADAGVREYWIVDPQEKQTVLYLYEKDAAPLLCPFGQEITSNVLKGFRICVSELLL